MVGENLVEMLNTASRSLEEDEETAATPEVQAEPVEEAAEATEATSSNVVKLVLFADWVEANNALLPTTSDITKVKISITDVDSSNSIGFKAPNVKGDMEEEKVKKDLFIVKNVADIKVLDLPLHHFKFFKEDLFRIIYKFSDEIYIKTYSIKTGPVVIFCTPVGENLLPYAKLKLKKKDESINIIEPDVAAITEKANGKTKLEDLQILYKQSVKFKDKLENMKDTIEWILKRYYDAIDVNHQIQIDGVLISLLK